MVTKKEPVTTNTVKVADTKRVMEALDKIRARDAELLKRLAK